MARKRTTASSGSLIAEALHKVTASATIVTGGTDGEPATAYLADINAKRSS
jgi:hypothetical protein